MTTGNTTSAGATAVFGLQWGDEGKGKAVDWLAARHDAVVRFNGGANAGHSVVVGGTRYSLHLIPSGILYPDKASVIGNGVVVEPETLLQELDGLASRGVDTRGLVVSDRAHVVLPYHRAEDKFREEQLAGQHGGEGKQTGKLGTTLRGIGPAYADKVQRAAGVRVGDLVRPDVLRTKIALACQLKNPFLSGLAEPVRFSPDAVTEGALAAGRRLAPMIRDTTYLLNDLLAQGKRILFEGANGTLLDVDHGTYPYVTASSTGTYGIGAGTGVAMSRISTCLGVMKAYSTRVGAGPLPTELHDDRGQRIRERGREYGTTTGRPRRVGWLDLVAVKYAAMINGTTGLALTMLDVLSGFDELRVCTAYRTPDGESDRFQPDGHLLEQVEPTYQTLPGFTEDIAGVRRMQDLPANARRYVDFIERFVGVPMAMVSVGPDREQTILTGTWANAERLGA